jgi:uncharacterized membrane protein YphA (DoxX/SURF4 family)
MRKDMDSGFRPPRQRALGNERRSVAIAELLATAALVLCTLMAATVVSVGIARADVADNIIGHEGSLFGIALLLGLVLLGIGSFSVPTSGKRKNR